MTLHLLRLAVAIVSAGLLGLYAVHAHEVWQEYRRDDLGFRVEMPGQPTINQEKRRLHDYGFHADVEYNSILFSVQYLENDTDSEEVMFKNTHSAFSMLAAINRQAIIERPITMSGLRGQEIIIEGKGKGIIARLFALNNKVFVMLVNEGDGVGPDNPNVRRFFDSFVPVPR
jgi:hypothetical protein